MYYYEINYAFSYDGSNKQNIGKCWIESDKYLDVPDFRRILREKAVDYIASISFTSTHIISKEEYEIKIKTMPKRIE